MSAAAETLDRPGASAPAAEPLLRIENLHVEFGSHGSAARVLTGVDLTVAPGEIVGLVGESGSGKSVTAMSIVGLLRGSGRITEGRILYRGRDLTRLTGREFRTVRGSEISMIFQNPRSSLNPVIRVDRIMDEVLRVHDGLTGRAAHERAIELFSAVGLADPASVLKRYAHQLSGGMAQRVMIALALASRPDLLIADEPTTALDVTIQYQIIKLLLALREETGLAQVVITHNLGVVAELCDRVAVMYAGDIVEAGSSVEIFDAPRHPYTRGLLAARSHHTEAGKLSTIPGQVPDLRRRPPGCPFHPRCAHARPLCAEVAPVTEDLGGHTVACHFHAELP